MCGRSATPKLRASAAISAMLRCRIASSTTIVGVSMSSVGATIV